MMIFLTMELMFACFLMPQVKLSIIWIPVILDYGKEVTEAP